ncbi:MAG: two-component sensor histidine kinase [Oscillospiraceae bacterium]|nr:two-component sensor histidine kinase [Oscillospiraceae bacterium]
MTKRIFRSIVIVATLVLFVCFGVTLGVLYSHYSDLQWQQLGNELTIAQNGLEQYGEDYLDTLSKGSFRFTWIEKSGTVLHDTQTSYETMDNHADREEIKEAFAYGTGESQRYSNTLTTKMLYKAVKLQDGSVLRISAAQDSVLALLLEVLFPLVLIYVIAIAVSLMLARRMANRIVNPLNDLDLDNPLSCNTYDEISPLLHRIEKQNKQISAQVAQLKEKTDQFEQTTSSMSEGLVLLDSEGKILSINPAAARLFETSKACVGLDFLVVDRSQAMSGGVKQALAKQHCDFHITKHGSEYQIGISPIVSGNRLLGAVVLAFDVTEQVNAQRNRQEFTANVSHELKTPLQSILNSAQLLQSGLVKPEDVQKFTGYICSEAERLLQLINDIIRLSQLDESVEFPQESVNLYAVTSQVLQTLLPAADSRNITVELLGEHTVITGVRQLAYELIYNLCDNAIRYNKDGGKVTVTVGKDSITVKDTGIGIPKEHQARIFERFYRVDKSHSRETGGTGLGLSIVKHAAQQLGAIIELESEPNIGTTVIVKF